MFSNLEAEIKRKGLTKAELAKKMSLAPSTLSAKLHNKAFFTLPEAREIKEILGVDIPLEELFAFNNSEQVY